MATPSTPSITSGTPTAVRNSTNDPNGFYYYRKGNYEFPMIGAAFRNRISEKVVNVGEIYRNDFTNANGDPLVIPNPPLTVISGTTVTIDGTTDSPISGADASLATTGSKSANSVILNDHVKDAAGDGTVPPRDEMITIDYFVWYADNGSGEPGSEVGRCPVDVYAGEGNQPGNVIA